MGRKAYLILENKEVFEGFSIGAEKERSGEVVFNTGMVGYPEGFTDPSYSGQILVMTYPLIGSYGVPPGLIADVREKNDLRASLRTNSAISSGHIPPHFESDRVHISGLVVSSYIENDSHWQSETTLGSWLTQKGVPAIAGIDTRTLTQTLREKGVMKGIIAFEPPRKGLFFHDPNTDNLVANVSCKEPVQYGTGKFRVLLIDCGVKLNQIRILVDLGLTVMRVPWDWDPFRDLKAKEEFSYDGIIISNGPGDPKMVKKTVATVKEALSRKIPTFGICLGNQILALAAGANTYKLKYGHRGQNQPVQDAKTKKCFITTHNHGYAVDTNSLPSGWKPWYTNLNDGTNEGIFHETLPFFSVQFHPEAAPGPTDTEWIFEYFVKRVKEWKGKLT